MARNGMEQVNEMGQNDHKRGNREPERKRRTFERERQQFDPTTIISEEFKAALEIALTEGGAIRLGLTRDGGALAVGIYGLGNEPSTEYLRPSDDAASFWAEVYAAFKGSNEV